MAEGDSIFLLGGSLNGVRLDRGNPTVTVAPGQRISGSVDISVVNSHEAHAVFPVGATPTWGDPRTSYWSIDYWAPALSTTQYQVPMELTAPATPGTYAVLFAAAPETSLAHVMSATRWYSGEPRWNDGDDIAGWGRSRLDQAIVEGFVMAPSHPEGASRWGATRVTVQVVGRPIREGGRTSYGSIAFASNRDGNWEVYVMNADGSGQTRLTDNPAWDRGPRWSPDGSRIAFVSQRDQNNDIYVMNADGSGQTRLTDNPARDGQPSW